MMNAEQKIRQAMQKIMDEGDVNASQVRKGFSASTQENGWHYLPFNSSSAVYLGNSVAEALEAIDEIAAERELLR